MNVCFVIYKYDVPLSDPCCYPMGAMYITSRVKELGHQVKVINYNLHEYNFEHEIQDQDVVMFTGYEEFYRQIYEDASICHKRKIKTVVGGALATFEVTRMLKVCDTVVTNWGDMVVEAALRKTGIVFGYRGEWWTVLPDYEAFDIATYHARHEISYMGVLGSQGCPYSCTFCAHVGKYSRRPLDNLMQEIDYYIDRYKTEMIVFNDNTLNADPEWFGNLVEEMGRRECSWSASIRLDGLYDDLVARMKKSGCRGLVVGVESFNQERLDKMNKRMKVSDIITGLDLLQRHGIYYNGNVLIGMTAESLDDIYYELNTIPPKYSLTPVFVRPFIGTQETCQPDISQEERHGLEKTFLDHILSQGKYLYPDLPPLEEKC